MLPLYSSLHKILTPTKNDSPENGRLKKKKFKHLIKLMNLYSVTVFQRNYF